MADDLVPNRTLAKLDPRTGKVTDYALKGEDGKSITTHSVVVDSVGRVWATGDGNFVMYDTRNGDFKEFRRPAGMRASVGGTLDVDSKGNPSLIRVEGLNGLGYHSPTENPAGVAPAPALPGRARRYNLDSGTIVMRAEPAPCRTISRISRPALFSTRIYSKFS